MQKYTHIQIHKYRETILGKKWVSLDKDTKILVRKYTKSSVHYYTRQPSAHMKI